MNEARKLELVTCFEDACDILSAATQNVPGVNRDMRTTLKKVLRSMKSNAQSIIEEEYCE